MKGENINGEVSVGTDFDSWYSESRYRMCVPKANTGSQQDRLVRGELLHDLVDICIGKI